MEIEVESVVKNIEFCVKDQFFEIAETAGLIISIILNPNKVNKIATIQF